MAAVELTERAAIGMLDAATCRDMRRSGRRWEPVDPPPDVADFPHRVVAPSSARVEPRTIPIGQSPQQVLIAEVSGWTGVQLENLSPTEISRHHPLAFSQPIRCVFSVSVDTYRKHSCQYPDAGLNDAEAGAIAANANPIVTRTSSRFITTSLNGGEADGHGNHQATLERVPILERGHSGSAMRMPLALGLLGDWTGPAYSFVGMVST